MPPNLMVASALALAMAGPAADAAAAPAKAGPAGIGLSCQLGPTGKNRLDAAEVCAAFRDALATSLSRPVAIVADRAHAPSGGWVEVRITNPRRGALQADFAGTIGRRKAITGPIVVEVIDKALDRIEVDKLANSVAKAVASR